MNPTVICTNMSLTTLPSFQTEEDPFARYPSGGGFYAQKFLYFEDNLITEIPAGAFSALGDLYPGANLTIDLSYNQINHIDTNALDGLSNNSVSLILRGNQLTSLSPALLSAWSLETLDISYNPLTSIDSNIVQGLAPMLKQFFVSVDHMKEMPKALSYLQAVLISVDGIRETEFEIKLQDNAHTEMLTELFISNSSLKDLSGVPCRFPNLRHLHLEENYDLRADMFGKCNAVENLTLNSLGIEKCNLTSVEISMYRQVRYLRLSENLFENVPESVLSLSEVWMVDLSYNQITSIDDEDFKGLGILADIILDGNPLTYISDSAFSTNNLRYLSLRKTLLTTIPTAVMNTQGLSSLSLPDNAIECSCVAMAHLNGWNMKYSNAHCKDDPDTSVYTYINDNLPLCTGQ